MQLLLLYFVEIEGIHTQDLFKWSMTESKTPNHCYCGVLISDNPFPVPRCPISGFQVHQNRRVGTSDVLLICQLVNQAEQSTLLAQNKHVPIISCLRV